MKNIVQRYFENQKKVPFIVRRQSWSENYGMLVTRVIPRKTPSGWYGKVYGYPLPPLNGSEENSYWGTTGKPEIIRNAGSYQWLLIKDIPDLWKPFLKPDA